MKSSTCKFCSKQFPYRSNKLFCSSSCRYEAWKIGLSAAKEPIPCFYCGMPADSQDHVPPKSVRTYLLSQGWSATLHFHEVDSCRECNCLLNDGEPYTPIGRKNKIKDLLRKRYHKYLELPTWTEAEIAAQGESFQIRESLAIKDLVLRRLDW